jgi:hypothetical protein
MKGAATLKTKPLASGVVVTIVGSQKESGAQGDAAKK